MTRLSGQVEDLGRIIVQWAHVLSGVLWIGGGFYTILVQLPALAAMPMPARGPALAALGPRQVRYVMRVAELTIATGILQIFVNPHAPSLTELAGLSSRWALAIVAGAVMAFVAYGILRGALKPAIERLLAIAPTAAGGDAAAAAQVGVIRERIRRLGYSQLALGTLIVGAMVTARFS
ncbi:MAG TPA: hypothetical protein VGS17_01995 [Candidatus Limnocylindria bacterium]|nr:hypothetical protein [Candidatus Limnocylindria bacterium]